MMKKLFILGLSLILLNCKKENSISDNHKKLNLLHDVSSVTDKGNLQVVIEIPAGTSAKWEVDKQSGVLKRDQKNGKPRTINYLPYPANYGFIPQTILPKELGGDGDPLDVIVIGDAVEKGTILQCKPIGVLYLLDNNEQDDKIIAISSTSVLFDKINSLEELQSNYKNITTILELWFTNYKGGNQMKSNSFGSENKAIQIINTASKAYDKKQKSTLN